MKTQRKVEISINCGEKTCAYEREYFCSYLGSRKFGQIPICCLFPSDDKKTYTDLEEVDGWTQRCESCLKAEHKERQ